jgi:hypothetical protein
MIIANKAVLANYARDLLNLNVIIYNFTITIVLVIQWLINIFYIVSLDIIIKIIVISVVD